MEAQDGKVLMKCWISLTDANPWKKTHESFSAGCKPKKKEAITVYQNTYSSTISLFGLAYLSLSIDISTRETYNL